MSAVTPPLVSPSDIEAYARDGVLVVRGLLTAEEVELARAGIAGVLDEPSMLAQVASGVDDPGRFVEDFRRWGDVPQIEQLARESRVPEVAAALLATPEVRFYHDHVLVKEGGTRQRTPWHQDQPYFNIDGMQNISMWIPVDPVSRAATLEFVAGSHKGPWLMPRTFMDNQANWFPEGSLQDLPDVEADRDAFPIVGWEIEPGDVVCFHMLTLHAAGGVEGPNRRRVFSVRFLGDDTRHAPRPWKTSPEFPGLADELPAGAEMDHPLFPLLVDGNDVPQGERA